MVKDINTSNESFTQKCGNCGAEHTIMISSLSVESNNPKAVRLPSCSGCNSIEFLLLNAGSNDHDIKVAQVFAYINASS